MIGRKIAMDTKLIELIKPIKAIAIDSYGVLISEYAYLDSAHTETIKRSHIDGQGISYLRGAGIRIALFADPVGHVRYLAEKFNALASTRSGAWPPVDVLEGDKTAALDAWLTKNGISWQECAAIADDVGDLPYLRKVGFAGAPAQAEEQVREAVAFVAERRGGDGAVRDFANVILKVKGIDPETLPKN